MDGTRQAWQACGGPTQGDGRASKRDLRKKPQVTKRQPQRPARRWGAAAQPSTAAPRAPTEMCTDPAALVPTQPLPTQRHVQGTGHRSGQVRAGSAATASGSWSWPLYQGVPGRHSSARTMPWAAARAREDMCGRDGSAPSPACVAYLSRAQTCGEARSAAVTSARRCGCSDAWRAEHVSGRLDSTWGAGRPAARQRKQTGRQAGRRAGSMQRHEDEPSPDVQGGPFLSLPLVGSSPRSCTRCRRGCTTAAAVPLISRAPHPHPTNTHLV